MPRQGTRYRPLTDEKEINVFEHCGIFVRQSAVVLCTKKNAFIQQMEKMNRTLEVGQIL